MAPSDATMRVTARYEYGDIDVSRLLDDADDDRSSAVFVRTIVLAERRWPATTDLDELRAIHRGLFEGVFNDAGRLRTRDTTREDTEDRARAKNPEAFFPANLIETGALNIATELADKRNLRNLDRGDFIRQLAHIYDELGYLHPFKGGNAMTLRIFASRLAHDAGWRGSGLGPGGPRTVPDGQARRLPRPDHGLRTHVRILDGQTGEPDARVPHRRLDQGPAH